MVCVLFVESSYTGAGKLCIDWCLEHGIRPILATRDKTPYSFLEEYGDRVEIFGCDTTSVNEIEKYIAINDVIPFFATTDDYSVETVAILREKYKQVTSPSARIKVCRDKDLLRQALAKLSPKNSVNHINMTKQGFPDTFTFPAVIKPSSYTGSIGVKLCLNTEDLINHMEDNGHLSPPGAFAENNWILEEYISGDEYSIEIADNKILGITKKYKFDLPFFVERGHIFPCVMDRNLDDEIKSQMSKIMRLLELTVGIYHVEVIINDGVLKIVEINARIPGDRIPQLIKCAIGVDIIDFYMNHTICKPKIVGTPTKNLHASIIYDANSKFMSDDHLQVVESRSTGLAKIGGKVESNLDRKSYQILVADSYEKLNELFETHSSGIPFRIRRACNKDLKYIKELHYYGLIESGSFSQDNDLDRDLDDIESHYSDGIFYLAVHEENSDQILGMGALQNINGDYHVKRMRVAASVRRSGIGTRIIKELIRYAKENNISELFLDTSEKQRAAQRLYENHGFTYIKSIVIGGIQSKLYKLTIN